MTYRPKFVKQFNDPTTTLDWFNCTMASGAMGLDFDTLGHIQVLGGQLRAVSGDYKGGTGMGTPGLEQAWDHYHQVLHVGNGGSWADVMHALKSHRGVILQGLYGALPKAYHSPLNSKTFEGPHAVYLNPEFNGAELLMGDPLNDKFIWVPEIALERYANALGSREYGASKPQRVFYGASDAHVPVVPVPPTDPVPYKHRVKVTASPSLNVRSGPSAGTAEVAPDLKNGEIVTTTELRRKGGRYVINGTVRTDWLGFLRGGKTVWIARGYTVLVA